MQDVVTAFLDYLDADGATPPNTLTAYRTDLTQFTKFLVDRGIVDAQALHLDDLQAFCAWLHERGYATTTIARRVAALRAFGAFLVQTSVVTSNPADGLRRPATVRLASRGLTLQQLAALRATMVRDATPEGWRDRAILEMCASTALRVSDLVALDVEDVDVATAVLIKRGRDGKRYRVPLAGEAIMALVAYLQLGRPRLLRAGAPSKALFLNHHGQRLTRQGVWAMLKTYAQQLQFADCSPEILRQSATALHGTTSMASDVAPMLVTQGTHAPVVTDQRAVSLTA